MNTLDYARAYLASLPSAISSARGHDATFRAACRCVRFGLSGTDAMALLREWNQTHCHPPWSEKELTHKLNDARRVAGSGGWDLRRRANVRVTWGVEGEPSS